MASGSDNYSMRFFNAHFFVVVAHFNLIESLIYVTKTYRLKIHLKHQKRTDLWQQKIPNYMINRLPSML